MPEGVSDYAVGEASAGYGGMSKMSVGRAAYPAPPSAEQALTIGDASIGGEKSEDRSQGMVSITRLDVTGALDKAAVRKVIDKKLSELAGQGSTAGKMTVQFTIQADGTVRDVKVTLNELGAGLERRVIDFVKKLRFAGTATGTTKVTVTLDFAP